jgi:phosphonate transport system ATP-binding protein
VVDAGLLDAGRRNRGSPCLEADGAVAFRVPIASSETREQATSGAEAIEVATARETGVIEVQGLRKVFPNGHEALKDVSLSVGPGEFVCVVGRSGAGKSTLLRCLNGMAPITAGSIQVSGVDIVKAPEAERRRLRTRIGFVYQEFNLVERLSVLRNVLVGRLGHVHPFLSTLGFFSRADRELALYNLDRVHLMGRATQRADSLSGGEKQRVSIARALTQEPLVLLADEPVASLDPELARGVMEDLHRVAKADGVPTLVNIHDVHLARAYADRVIGIAQGVVVFDGPVAQLDEAALDRIYRFDAEEQKETARGDNLAVPAAPARHPALGTQ